MNLIQNSVAMSKIEDLHKVSFPQGLVGFPQLTEMEIFYSKEELPFMRLRDVGSSGLEFLVIDPCGLPQEYNVQITDLDLFFLDIKTAEDVLLLNIVTVHPDGHVTINLVGPLAINRHVRKGKQIVIGNYQQYSADHLLYSGDESAQSTEG